MSDGRSKWTHAICDVCWLIKHPDLLARRIVEEFRDHEKCCYCGQETFSGLYERADPAGMLCGGVHPA